MLRHDIQLVFVQLREQILGQDQRIQIGGVKRQPRLPAPLPDKADVKLRVVGNQRAVPHKFQEGAQGFRRFGRVLQHRVGDAGDCDIFRSQMPARVHEGLEAFPDLSVLYHHGPNLCNGVLLYI